MKTKDPIVILLENGMEFSTLKNMSDRQIKVLSERFKKEESKEAVNKTVYQPLKDPKDLAAVQDMVTKANPNASVELGERFESKSQQGLFWAKCNNSKGKEKTKWCKMAREFSDSTTKKEYKDMPEKKNPEKTVKYKKSTQKENYEKVLEDRILEMVQKNINPRITKGDLNKNISERSESMMLKNPKKNSMFSENEGMEMKRPIVRMSSMGENTKEKERTKTPGIKTTPKRRNNPHKDPNPGVKENPKAGMEKQKNDFMNIIKQALNV